VVLFLKKREQKEGENPKKEKREKRKGGMGENPPKDAEIKPNIRKIFKKKILVKL